MCACGELSVCETLEKKSLFSSSVWGRSCRRHLNLPDKVKKLPAKNVTLWSAALIVYSVRIQKVILPSQGGFGKWQVALLLLAHLTISFLIWQTFWIKSCSFLLAIYVVVKPNQLVRDNKCRPHSGHVPHCAGQFLFISSFEHAMVPIASIFLTHFCIKKFNR